MATVETVGTVGEIWGGRGGEKISGGSEFGWFLYCIWGVVGGHPRFGLGVRLGVVGLLEQGVRVPVGSRVLRLPRVSADCFFLYFALIRLAASARMSLRLALQYVAKLWPALEDRSLLRRFAPPAHTVLVL